MGVARNVINKRLFEVASYNSFLLFFTAKSSQPTSLNCSERSDYTPLTTSLSSQASHYLAILTISLFSLLLAIGNDQLLNDWRMTKICYECCKQRDWHSYPGALWGRCCFYLLIFIIWVLRLLFQGNFAISSSTPTIKNTCYLDTLWHRDWQEPTHILRLQPPPGLPVIELFSNSVSPHKNERQKQINKSPWWIRCTWLESY